MVRITFQLLKVDDLGSIPSRLVIHCHKNHNSQFNLFNTWYNGNVNLLPK